MYKVVWTKKEYDWRERNNKEVRLFKDKNKALEFYKNKCKENNSTEKIQASCTVCTWLLYGLYKAFVLKVHGICTKST